MAILNSLIVSGASRFLNTAYFQDVSISGSANFASISASGDITAGGNLKSTTGNLYLKNLLAIRGSVDTWLRINDANAFTSGTYFGQNTIRTDGTFQVGANGSAVNIYYQNGNSNKAMTVSIPATFNGATTTISNLAAPIATINNATISGDLTVNGVLHSNEFIKNIVKAVGGQLYVSPTFQATSSTTISCISADTSYVYLTLQDNGITSSEYAGATWYSGSKIMLSGTLTANTTGHTEEILFSSAPGELTAQMNGGTNGAKKLQIKVEHDNASTYFKAGSLTFSDVAVMMYQLKNGSNYFPIGIYIKAYGTDNQKSYIDIFGGSDTTPNARLGLLTGLGSMPSGSTIQGWGIYTDNGFFKGIIEANGGLIGNWTIGESSMYYSSDAPSSSSIVLAPGGKTASVNIGGSGTSQKSWVFTVKNLFGVDTSGALYSSSGKIGGWNIGASSLYNTTNSMTSTGVGLYLGTDGIRNYASGTQYVNITSGKITALGVDVSGKITATSGAIGGFDITSTAIKTKDVAVTSNADNSISLSSADFTRTINSTSREGLRFAIGDKFGVTGDGTIYAGSANISGTLTAGNGSKIGDLTVANGKLSVPAANITGTLSANHIDTSSITIGQSQVDGLSTALGNAAKTATNYLTDITNDGVFVHESNGNNVTPSTAGANGVHISDEVDIIRKGEIVATYGEKIRLGKQAVAHSEFDEDSFTLFDTSHKIFAHLGGTNELVHITTNLRIDQASDFKNYTTPCYVFPLYTPSGMPIPAERIIAVTSVEILKKKKEGYDTVPLVESEDYNVNGNVVTLLNEPVYNQDRLRVYVDISAMGDNTPFYTLGTRRTGSNNTSLTGIGDYSMAEGHNTYAQGHYSHAEGYTTDSDGTASHAEGYTTGAYAMGAHAEGYGCKAGNWMHAEEQRGDHAEGYMTTAQGDGGSHAEGYRSSAYGFASHAQNEYTETWARAQTVLGTFNEVDPSGSTTHHSGNLEYRQNAVIIGNGTDGDNRSNALTVDWSGNVWTAGKVMAANTSHIGMIIMSTTLNTMAKVIAQYGGTTWIKHSGYFLYGASSNVVANSATATGGEATHTLTVNEMPNHSHKVRYTGGYANGFNGGMPGTSVDATPGYNDLLIAYEGGGAAHNNMPPYKNVYIWERTA